MKNVLALSAVALLTLSSAAFAGNSQTYGCNKQPDENGFSAGRCSNTRTSDAAAAHSKAEKAEKAASGK